MTTLEEQLQKYSHTISLSSVEKAEIREGLVEYMTYRPLQRTLPPRHTKVTWGVWFGVRHLRGALLIALIVAISTGGVSYAAVDALPGDLLYPVKININEEMKAAFLSTDESRVEWERERVELRLAEASQLVAEGRLDSERTEEVVRLLDEHVDAMVDRVRMVKDTDPFLAAEVTDEFETSLDTHEAVLARFAVEDSKGETRDLVEKVHAIALATEKVREEVEERIDDVVLPSDTDIDTTPIHDGGNNETENSEGEDMGRDVGGTASNTPSALMRDQVVNRARVRAMEQLQHAEVIVEKSNTDEQVVIDALQEVEKGRMLITYADGLVEVGKTRDAYQGYRQAAGALQKITQLLEVHRMFSIEIPSPNSVEESSAPTAYSVMNIEDVRSKATSTVAEAQHALIDAQHFNNDGVAHKANTYIKDAAASLLRAEIAESLQEYDNAKILYRNAYESALHALQLIEQGTLNQQSDIFEEYTQHAKDAPYVLVKDLLQADGSRIFSGTVVGYDDCITVTPIVTQEGSTTSLQLSLVSQERVVFPCPASSTTFEVTTHHYGHLRAVVLDGVEQAFSVNSTDASSTPTEDNTTSDMFQRVLQATHDMLSQ